MVIALANEMLREFVDGWEGVFLQNDDPILASQGRSML
jgi:hypothetical protein